MPSYWVPQGNEDNNIPSYWVPRVKRVVIYHLIGVRPSNENCNM
jgi:hypothetical protein